MDFAELGRTIDSYIPVSSKVLGIAAAVVGVAAVGIYIACGKNPRVAASIGPRWRSSLLAAGLALLAVFGIKLFAEQSHHEGPTCYAPTPILSVTRGVDTLNTQTDLLEQLIAQDAINTDTADMAIERVVYTLGTMSGLYPRMGIMETHSIPAPHIMPAVNDALAVLKKLDRLVLKHSDWKKVRALQKEITAILQSDRDAVSVPAERGEILRQITDANALLDGLVAKRLLHETEASLLKADLVEQRRQLEDVWADTGDERTAADMCYLRLQAKKESLSMLGEYCEHPAAIRESLDAVRRDLTYISIERQQQNITVTHDTVAVSQLVAHVSESMQRIDRWLLLFAASTYRELPASITTPPPANTTDEH